MDQEQNIEPALAVFTEEERQEAMVHDVKDTVENLTLGIGFGSSTGFGRWDERFEDAPLSIAEVCRIRFSRFHACDRTAI
jgi:hypothetical protein